MTRRAAAVALALAGLLCLLVGGPAAHAVDAPAAGWWSRLATATPTDEIPAALPVPAPAAPDTIPAGATVPEGQLLVESTPEGAVAVAAARWVLARGESSPSLTIPIGEGSTLNPQSVVLACKAAAPWSPAESGPGSWETKPLVDASRCVNGVIAADLSSVTFGVQPLVSGNDLDVVLVAGKVAGAELPPGVPAPPVDADTSAFRLVFPTPTAESVEVVAGSDFEEGEGDVVVVPPGPPEVVVDDIAPSPAVDLPTSPSPTVPMPSVGVDEPVAAPALEPQDLAPSVPDVARALDVVSTQEAERTIGYVLLLLAAGMATWAYASNEQSTGIGLGRFRTAVPVQGTVPALARGSATPTVGGLSRFARERTTPPSRLA